MYDVAPDDAQAAQLDQHVGARARLAGGTKPPAATGNVDDSASVPAAAEIDPRLTIYGDASMMPLIEKFVEVLCWRHVATPPGGKAASLVGIHCQSIACPPLPIDSGENPLYCCASAPSMKYSIKPRSKSWQAFCIKPEG